ncbi:hypothetical protein KY363_04585 [Candidatus Woesearchaeota archaeon]|nr:hypothetical protein [Candidatus Woesearchaeota archaeon]
MTSRHISDEEARELVYLLAAESGLRIRKEDLSIQTRDRMDAETIASIAEESHTYRRLQRLEEHLSRRYK